MSNKTLYKHGYGICTNGIETTPERMETLLALVPECRKMVHSYFEGMSITKPVMQDYLCLFDDAFRLGLAAILKEVILEAEGINLTACESSREFSVYLICEPSYPWQMSEKDLALTEEKLAAIFRKYANILTDVPIELGLQEIANGD